VFARYNPKIRVAESVPGPYTDERTEEMLEDGTDSWAFVAEYGRLRSEGMDIEQAMVFIGHRFRMRHLWYLTIG
jgi:hypothetical protein